MLKEMRQTLQDVDNELVRQKDRIIFIINDGHFTEAMVAINTVEGLWKMLGYGYKTTELRRRLQEAQNGS